MKNRADLPIFLTLAFLLFSNFAQAQAVSGSSFWLKADVGIAQANGKVSKWNSQDGAGRFGEQTADASRPLLVPNAINGLPAVRFGGAQFLECSPVYPVARDYTLMYVVQLSNLGVTNNIVSGNSHATFSNPPRLLHGDFNTLAVSSTALTTAPALVTVRFWQSGQRAFVSVNGSKEDTSFVGTNADSILQIGSFQKANFMVGNVAEVLLYPRNLSPAEVKQTEDYLLTRYGIKRVAVPIIDSTFAVIPQSKQFFARDANNGADVEVRGEIKGNSWDSIRVKLYRDNLLSSSQASRLTSLNGAASFAFTARLNCELKEYRLEVSLKNSTKDSIIAVRDSLVCGDVFLISGQSNTVFPGVNNQHEFVRTFGGNYSQNKKDTLWSIGSGGTAGGGSTIGAWGLRLAELIVMNQRIPVCIINGGVGGTSIEQNSRLSAQPEAVNTIYGSLLYRVRKSQFADKAKAMFWYQGESNSIANYAQNFHKLQSDWLKDYPSLKKFYVVQIRPGCGNDPSHDRLRDFLRAIQDTIPNVESVAAVGLPGHDGCHYTADGYTTLGNQMYRLVERDFYAGQDTTAISSPTPAKSYFTSNARNQLAVVFRPRGSLMTAQSNLSFSATAQIKDHIYLSDSVKITGLQCLADTVFLDLERPSNAQSVSYIPAVYYNGTSTIYQGPWLLNQRGVGALTFWRFPITAKSIVDIDHDPQEVRQSVIYPIPSADYVRVESRSKDGMSIRGLTIVDDLGRSQLVSYTEDEEGIVVDTRSYSTGSFVLSLHFFDGTSVTERFVVLR